VRLPHSYGVTPSELLVSRGTRTTLRSGTTLFREGDRAAVVCGVVRGCVRIEVSTSTGGRLVLGMKEAGDLVGELGALDGRPRSATAVALHDVELVQMSIDNFLMALEEQPGLAVELLRRISRDLRDSIDRTTARASADTTQRLAMPLFDLAERFGETNSTGVEIDLALTQDDVAGWIGATREATARSLRTLRESNCVVTARRRHFAMGQWATR
jgi:CRP/FNR family cyclic AMP-dependent transcriptional regulator